MNVHLRNLLLMRMQIAWFCLFSFNSLCSAILTALAGTQWNQVDAQTKWMIFIGVGANWTNTIMALFSKATARIESGGLPFSDSQPAPGTVEKTITSQVKTTTTPVEPTP